jgi:hypothetical protein
MRWHRIQWLVATYDQHMTGEMPKETLSIIYRHSSVETLSLCRLYIDIRLERVEVNITGMIITNFNQSTVGATRINA